MTIPWRNPEAIDPRSYTCGYCGKLVGPDRGFSTTGTADRVFICSFCRKPSYFDATDGSFTPGAAYGRAVEHLPHDVAGLYNEARECMKVNAFTSAVLTARKLLMHIAVEKGANENLTFFEYVKYLGDNGFVPPGGEGWVDHIRERGNEANHEIELMGADDARRLIDFTGMLLVFVYELPGRVPPPAPVT